MVKFERIVLDASKDGVEIAKRLLSKIANRKLRPWQVTKLAKLMLSGKWQEDASMEIVQTSKGFLKEGQNRLNAFITAAAVKPNLKIAFYLKTGVPDEQAYAVQANQASWNAGDVLDAQGMDGSIGKVVKLIKNRGCSTIVSPPTHEDILESAKEMGGLISEIRDHVKDIRKIKTAPVLAALVRGAMSTGKKEEVLRFCEILSEGQPKSPSEQWALRLYRVLSEERGPRNYAEVLRSYRKTETALHSFLGGTPCKADDKVIAARKEMFPLSGEPAGEACDRTRRFLIFVPARGSITSASNIEKALEKRVLQLNGIVSRKIPSGAKLALASLADKKVVAIGTVKSTRTGDSGIPELVLLNAEKIEPREIDGMKLVSLSCSQGKIPSMRDLTKQATKLTAADMALLTA